MTTRVALLGAIAITALVVGSGFSEDALRNAPTNAAGGPWGMRLAEFQKTGPNAQCQITHARDYRRDPPGPSESGREQYDLERGTVTTTRPVTFRATCEESLSGPEAGQMFLLPERTPAALHQRISHLPATRLSDHAQQTDRALRAAARARRPAAVVVARTVGRWVGPSTDEAERLIWRRLSATVTLSSAEYAHLGRKSGATTLVLSATRP